MSEAFPGERLQHEAVDIELEIPSPNEVPVVPAQEGRRVPQTFSERIATESTLQIAYATKGAILMQLEEALRGIKMPDFNRVSAVLPIEALPAVNEAVDGLAANMLYATTTRQFIKLDIEAIVRKNRFAEVIAEQNKLVQDSRARVAKLQEQQQLERDAARANTNDFVAAEHLLKQMRQEMAEDGKLVSMPEVAANQPRVGLFDKIKKMLS